MKLLEFSLITILQHRHSFAVLSTEGPEISSFFPNLISSLPWNHTYQSLSSAFCTAVSHGSYCCLDFCTFLPLSVIFKVVFFSGIEYLKLAAPLSIPLQTNPVNFLRHICVPIFLSTLENKVLFDYF